jgi:hypothetical protein
VHGGLLPRTLRRRLHGAMLSHEHQVLLIFFSIAQQPTSDQVRLFGEVSRSHRIKHKHTHTHS